MSSLFIMCGIALILWASSFYGGGLRERSILLRAYMRLIKHVNSIYKVSHLGNLVKTVTSYQSLLQIRIAYEWTEDFLIKYLWSAAGYCLISIPVFWTRVRNMGVQTNGPRPHERTDNEVANRTESTCLDPSPDWLS